MITLTPQQEDSTIGHYIATMEAINYHNEDIKPKLDILSGSDTREYLQAYDMYKEDEAKHVKHMMKHQSVFNNLLSNHGLTVVTLIAKANNYYSV